MKQVGLTISGKRYNMNLEDEKNNFFQHKSHSLPDNDLKFSGIILHNQIQRYHEWVFSVIKA